MQQSAAIVYRRRCQFFCCLSRHRGCRGTRRSDHSGAMAIDGSPSVMPTPGRPSATKTPLCVLRPSLTGLVSRSWADMLSSFAWGFRRALVMCAPAQLVDQSDKKLDKFARSRNVDSVRHVKGIRAARGVSKFASLADACVLLLSAQDCFSLKPNLIHEPSNLKALPAVLVWSMALKEHMQDQATMWEPFRRSAMEARRINGCGLHAECFLLELAEMARASDGTNKPSWSSLADPWPAPQRLPSWNLQAEATADDHDCLGDATCVKASARPGSFGTAWQPLLPRPANVYDSDGVPTISQCLLQYIDEVVRMKPVATRKARFRFDRDLALAAASRPTAAAAVRRREDWPPHVLVPHYTHLSARKRSMRDRLRTASLDVRAQFLEMRPDYVNDTMRHCLGHKRRKSIDSMSDTPTWRFPTRGEDSLAVKHIAAALWLVRSGCPHALVLEDDAWFSQHFAADLRELLSEVQKLDWDIIAVGTCYHHRTPFGRQVLPHIWMTQIMPCAHAYLLSQKGARAFLRTLPLQLPIDLQLNLIAQDGADYEVLRRAGADGHQLPNEVNGGRIFWTDPQLAFQWPEDATRTVERND
eukprot:TRINITY_DN34633_c0_g1_i1.p1 TRINITY_DN34633_c0_g1~~TRINITY_DN34633_c0_g1_i1.p1  ORF type:complete len:586 (+),score=73.97 TRINITY_DN34633_c0_g1_i1:38-1795(+)